MRSSRAPARPRACRAAIMDPRGRANSTAVKGLLGRQLASITDTLARASMRRDAELQKKAASELQGAPAVQAPFPPSTSDPSSVDTDGTASESGGSAVVDVSGKGPDMRDFGSEEADMESSKGKKLWNNEALRSNAHDVLTNAV
jgi:septal ring factor EnvC (AmiA/AmiB activator)